MTFLSLVEKRERESSSSIEHENGRGYRAEGEYNPAYKNISVLNLYFWYPVVLDFLLSM